MIIDNLDNGDAFHQIWANAKAPEMSVHILLQELSAGLIAPGLPWVFVARKWGLFVAT